MVVSCDTSFRHELITLVLFCVLTLDYVMSSLEFLYFILPMKFIDFPNMNLWYWFPFLWLLVMGQCLFVQWLVLVWICRFPLPLGVWEGLRLVIVALPGLLSYLFFFLSISIFFEVMVAHYRLDFEYLLVCLFIYVLTFVRCARCAYI